MSLYYNNSRNIFSVKRKKKKKRKLRNPEKETNKKKAKKNPGIYLGEKKARV